MWLDALRQMKAKTGLTTSEISLRSGIPEPTLEKLFSGATKDPKLPTMQKLVHFFGCTLDDLDDEKTAPARKGRELTEEEQRVIDAYRTVKPVVRDAVRCLLEECAMSPGLTGHPLSAEEVFGPRSDEPKAMEGETG